MRDTIQAASKILQDTIPPLPQSVAARLRSGRLTRDEIKDRLRFWFGRGDFSEFAPLIQKQSAEEHLEGIVRLHDDTIEWLTAEREEAEREADRLTKQAEGFRALSLELKSAEEEQRKRREEALAKLKGG